MKFRRLGPPSEPRFSVIFHPAAEREYVALPQQVQHRFERAIERLAHDPYVRHPMADVTKLAVLDTGETLYRLRVGERRACYAVITSDREVWMLIFEDRELGFRRLIKTATARFRSVP